MNEDASYPPVRTNNAVEEDGCGAVAEQGGGTEPRSVAFLGS
ncbi:hypothetical protein [Streptomyces sp. NBC_01565]|nr:hypothetical protein [Streptomyces sp. NBC_01565]MCX4546994.1 hypothetical protein [Streptomyces sp. NBC_01565]